MMSQSRAIRENLLKATDSLSPRGLNASFTSDSYLSSQLTRIKRSTSLAASFT